MSSELTDLDLAQVLAFYAGAGDKRVVAAIEELQEKRRILADMPEKAIDAGWTFKDVCEHAGRLESEIDVLHSTTKSGSRISELERICGESYQAVGALADKCGIFETSEAVSKAMDNLSQMKLVHEDILPFWLD